jgi:glutathione peroxidase
MIKLFMTLSVLWSLQSDIYQLSFKDNQGNVVNLSAFRGKKILIVNTASQSKYASQYSSLEQLYEKYQDSLMIIAFPSNDFGKEPGNDSAIASYVAQYNIQFTLAAKSSVSGANIDSVYGWLTDGNQNGQMSNPVPGNFFKYLINSNGMIIGLFAPQVDPMDSTIQQAITN